MFATQNDIDETFGIVESYWGKPKRDRRILIYHCDYHCNIQCEHCLITEKIRTDFPGRIPDDIAERLIMEAGKNNLAVYPVSGDPWCWYDYLKNFLLPMCEKYNTRRLISTNGKWGEDPTLIKEALELPIQNLILTVDYYHQKHIPIQSINNILDAFKNHPTKVFIASCFTIQHPLSEVSNMLKYRIPIYPLPLIEYNEYFDNNRHIPGLFYRKQYNGEIVHCRPQMFFVNDFAGNLYRECASFLRGYPCLVGNIMETSMADLIKKKDTMRLKYKLYGEFDQGAPHTEACVWGQTHGQITNFFEDRVHIIDNRNKV